VRAGSSDENSDTLEVVNDAGHSLVHAHLGRLRFVVALLRAARPSRKIDAQTADLFRRACLSSGGCSVCRRVRVPKRNRFGAAASSVELAVCSHEKHLSAMVARLEVLLGGGEKEAKDRLTMKWLEDSFRRSLVSHLVTDQTRDTHEFGPITFLFTPGASLGAGVFHQDLTSPDEFACLFALNNQAPSLVCGQQLKANLAPRPRDVFGVLDAFFKVSQYTYI
jgi:hypothetical protein